MISPMTNRSKDGRETWRRLLEWDKGPAPSERLAGHVLRFEGFQAIDPSHPLGGPDGLKDLICSREGKKWIGAAYFPRGQQSITDISKKFEADLVGVSKNSADGLAFVTNQELTLSQRGCLVDLAKSHRVEIFHLERLASILDSPQCYGLRLEFLDIELSKEEQVAYFAQRDAVLLEMQDSIDTLVRRFSQKSGSNPTASGEIPTVYPRSLGPSFLSLMSLGGPQPHECKGCGAVFMVSKQRPPSASIYVGEMIVITCPSCGRTERYNGLLW